MRINKKPLAVGQRRYSVSGVITISMHTEVVASSPDEARRIAIEERGLMTLCHSCSSASPTYQWVTSGELDADRTEPHDGDTDLEVTEID